MTRSDIVAEARRWIGTPFHHQAYQRGAGCDCIGLVRGIVTALGIMDASDENPALKGFLGYAREPVPGQLVDALDRFLVRIATDDAREGDVVLFLDDMGRRPQPRHIGILNGQGGMIHATQRIGEVVEHALNAKWLRRRVAAWSFPGLV